MVTTLEIFFLSMLFFHLLLINYFTNTPLTVKHRLSFKGLLSYDPKYFQSSLTTLDISFLRNFITDHRFDIREKMLVDSLNLLKQGLIHKEEQTQVKRLTKNLFHFKIHLGSDYFHPILQDIRRTHSKIDFWCRIYTGKCRNTVKKNDHKKRKRF